MTENGAHLEQRYRVEKVNDPTGRHDECRYFVLDPKHDPHAAAALLAYAAAVGGTLASEIRSWLSSLYYCQEHD